MKRLLMCLLALCVFCEGVAMADEAGHRSLAEELLAIMNVEASMERVFQRVKQGQVAQLRKLQTSEEESRIIEAAVAELQEIIDAELNWGQVKDDYIHIYMQTLSEGELREIVAFYRTAAGRKFVEKTPELMRKSFQVNERQMGMLAPKIRAVTLQVVKDIGVLKKIEKGGRE